MFRRKPEETESERAKRVILIIAMKIIDIAIPGEDFTRRLKGMSPGRHRIKKTDVIDVFKLIIDQTNELETPVTVNFRYGKAADIGIFLNHFLHDALSIEITDMRKKGAKMPTFDCGWIDTPDRPFFKFSDLLRNPKKRSKVIELHDGKNPKVQKITMLLSDILRKQ